MDPGLQTCFPLLPNTNGGFISQEWLLAMDISKKKRKKKDRPFNGKDMV